MTHIHSSYGNRGAAFGRSLRDQCPLQSHANTAIRGAVQRDIIALFDETNKDRVAHLVPLRHARMSQSAFCFYRGTAFIQAFDLMETARTGLTVQASGDCHLSNFGGFATPERNLIFDLNDFDETYQAPWEWDIKRLTTSFVLAGREQGIKSKIIRKAVKSVINSYRSHLTAFANMSALDIWYSRLDWESLKKAPAARKKSVQKLLTRYGQKALKRNSEQVLLKITSKIDGEPRITDMPPSIYHPDPAAHDLNKEALGFLAKYRDSLRDDMKALFDRFRFVDAAVKVVGVGSVGTRCLIALMLDEKSAPLFLQIKEAGASVLEGLSPIKETWDNQGRRVVEGLRLTQASSDPFLGWVKNDDGREFYVRQLRDMKIGLDSADITPELLILYAKLCSRALARAHARTGDASAISGYIGENDKFFDAIMAYSNSYADQVEQDFRVFLDAIKLGRLPAMPLT